PPIATWIDVIFARFIDDANDSGLKILCRASGVRVRLPALGTNESQFFVEQSQSTTNRVRRSSAHQLSSRRPATSKRDEWSSLVSRGVVDRCCRLRSTVGLLVGVIGLRMYGESED